MRQQKVTLQRGRFQQPACIGSWEYDVVSGCLSGSSEANGVLDYDPADGGLDQKILLRRCHSNDRTRCRQVLAQAVRDGKPFSLESRIVHKDGTIRWIRTAGWGTRSTTGEVARLLGTVEEITEYKRQEEHLRTSEERFALAMDATGDGLFDWEIPTGTVTVNRSWLRWLGYTEGATTRTIDFWETICHPEDLQEAARRLESIIHRCYTTCEFEHRLRHRDGHWVWVLVRAKVANRDEEGQATRIVGTHVDITARKQLEAERERLMEEAVAQADCDPLTTLLNHRTFYHRLQVEAMRAQQENTTLGVIVMDMDNFKFFNDTYGHLVGDEVLCSVAETLRGACRAGDAVARLGGDEFALLLSRVSREEAEEAVARVREAVQTLTFRAAGEQAAVPLRLSVGVSLFPEETNSSSEAVYLADARAMRDKSGESGNDAAEVLRASLCEASDGFAMLDSLVVAVDRKDRYTRRHSSDVLCWSGRIGRAMRLPTEEVRSLEIAALVHDVGKIGVPVQMLRQPGSLSEAETTAIQQHAALGDLLVGAVPELSHTRDAVRHHHERWDGAGYPDGLAGDAIPLAARVLAVADAFSAMTTDRPYRVGMQPEQALEVLERGAGQQWDPLCVRILTSLLRRQELMVHICPISSPGHGGGLGPIWSCHQQDECRTGNQAICLQNPSAYKYTAAGS